MTTNNAFFEIPSLFALYVIGGQNMDLIDTNALSLVLYEGIQHWQCCESNTPLFVLKYSITCNVDNMKDVI